MAESAIQDAERIINEMKKAGFSIVYVNDTLLEAKKIFVQAENAEILRDESSSESEKALARENLKLISWKDIDYTNVLKYTDEIKRTQEQVILIQDTIRVKESEVNLLEQEEYDTALFSPSTEIQTEESRRILEEIKKAFREERYNEAEQLLEEFKLAVEKEKAEASTLSQLRRGALGFFKKYWLFILLFLIALSIAGYFLYKKTEKRVLLEKIIKMQTERKVLIDLIKKSQIERFKENKIPGLIYNIRMKNYKERLQEIKQDLPVLEERFHRLVKKKKQEKIKK